MKTKILLGLFLVLALTLLSLMPIQRASAATYNVGVAPGNSFTYQFSASWNTSNSPYSGSQNIKSATIQITKVSSPRLNGTLTYSFTNGTSSKTSFLQGDLSSGGGNLTFFIIPAGLNGGDSFPFQGSIVTLSSSSTVTILGVSRMADFLNYSTSSNGYSFREGLAWDKLTGALIDVSFAESIPNPRGQGSFNVFLTDTSVWTSYILGLPPAIFYTIIGLAVVIVAIVSLNILRKGIRPPTPPPVQTPATGPPANP